MLLHSSHTHIDALTCALVLEGVMTSLVATGVELLNLGIDHGDFGDVVAATAVACAWPLPVAKGCL